MKNKYFYGTEDCEYYTATDLDGAYEDEILDGGRDDGDLPIGSTIIEMKRSRESGEKWCTYSLEFIDECLYCEDYKPRNGKNGICKYLSYGLIATGRKWIITGAHEYKKISSRRK